MVDVLASEYGWSIEYVMDLPCDIVAQLTHAILARKGAKTRRVAYVRDESAEPLATRLGAIWGEIDTDE